MRARPLVLGALLALPSFWSLHVRAEPRDFPTARALYAQGARAYSEGNFEAAIAAFESAYAISGKPALLFNIAQAERLAGPGHCERALRAYERFLRDEPSPSNVGEVERRISEMKACSAAEQAPAPAQRPQSTVAVSESAESRGRLPSVSAHAPKTSSKVGPLVTLGSGAALAGTGAAIYLLARAKFDEVASSCPCREGQFAGWQRATNVSYGLLVLGGTAIVTGATWWLLDTRQDRAPGYAVGFVGGRVSIAGRF